MADRLMTLNDAADVALRRCSAPLCRLLRYEPWPYPNDHLLGHADVDFDGWEIHRIPIFRRRDGMLSPGVPSAALLDRDGVQLRDDNGKRRYTLMMGFSAEGKSRWERTILAALSDAGITP